MRNPLSAILQCAENIMSLQEGEDSSTANSEVLGERMRDAVDSAETILQCGKHMKTIVDGKFSDCRMALPHGEPVPVN